MVAVTKGAVKNEQCCNFDLIYVLIAVLCLQIN